MMSDLSKDQTEPVKGEEHLSEHERLARRLNLPDSWVEAVEEMRRAGPKLVEEWEAEERARGERQPN
ncbi:hypothetical protein [Deinococcus sp. DB0503]|uniref:hypothetical protein n=1 Tax=Deinococcus sp. DB0503 TaxID=2479203 RepID=UPI0018DF9957|nr:hypothetical protein [Deinococcus sp. DB0503]MBI0446978.1 hypothetical protein [Deinococcus sp. DB0503]